ncbi:MAG: acylphosphatase [Actinomycetota bacterium]|nr:acylphosphatase [Actinomycetota bacterium]
MAGTLKRVHLHVSGRVQGVFYRAECANRARQLGLAGFVRNLPDGRVEAAFEGPEEAVDNMVQWCREGTRWAQVEEVEATDEEPAGDKDFRVER